MVEIVVAIVIAVLAAAGLYFGLMVLTCLPKKEQPHGEQPRAICVGDSITFGMGVNWSRKKDCWVRRLEKLLNGRYQILNYGICGATLQREGNQPYRKSDFLKCARQLRPELFILMLGTNDSKPYNWNAQRYEKELAEMLCELKGVPSVKKVFVMVPPFAVPKKGKDKVAFDIQNEVIRDEIRPIVIRQAKTQGVACIDLYSVTENHPEYYKDGVHPNKLGNQVIAEHIAGYLQ